MQYIQLSLMQQVWIWQTLKLDFSVLLKSSSKASAKLNSASLGQVTQSLSILVSVYHRSQSWTLAGFQASTLKWHLYPQLLSVLKTEILCEHGPVHSTCKQVFDVFVSNGICGNVCICLHFARTRGGSAWCRFLWSQSHCSRKLLISWFLKARERSLSC